MKFFKDTQGTVYAYDSDGSQDDSIKPGLTAITNEQADALRAPVSSVPTVITMRQARRALLEGGYLDMVDTLIASMPGEGGDAARIDWQYAAEVDRTHPLVSAMSVAIPLNSTQLDDLFSLGATL